MKKLDKQTKTLLIIILVALVLIWAARKFRQDQETSQIEAGSDASGAPKPTTGSSIPSWQKKYNALPELGDDALLKKGIKSKEVWNLQYLYNTKVATREGKAKITVDGIFGSQTETAVKYVLNGKYNYTRLKNWRQWVTMTKQQRIDYMKARENSGEALFDAAGNLGGNISTEWSTPYY